MSQRQRGGGDSTGRPEFPALVEQIGDDPARYLFERERWVALARIRGLRTFEEVRAFRAVERNLATREGRDTREWVMEALDEREADLEERGVFDPDTDRGRPDPGPYTPDQWERDAGGLPSITPHEENIARPATDGGEDGDPE